MARVPGTGPASPVAEGCARTPSGFNSSPQRPRSVVGPDTGRGAGMPRRGGNSGPFLAGAPSPSPPRRRSRYPRGSTSRREAIARLLDNPADPSATLDAALTAQEVADRRAVARARAGHPEAFEEVVRRHESGVLALCSRLVHDGGVGEDLAQEAFEHAYSRLDSFRGRCTFRHWLYRIAANGCRDFLKAGGRSERPADMSGDELCTLRDPERDAVARQSLEALSAAVASLPPACRHAFVLFYLENLSYEEMSVATGVAVNALKVRVHRARELLRRRLRGQVEAPVELPR